MHCTPPRRVLAMLSVILILLLFSRVSDLCEARILRRGMRGTDVVQLQELLVELGYELAIDGVFGGETEALVKQLQRTVELDVDGLVGPATMSMLEHLKESVLSYTVQQGDNLSTLAIRYDSSVRDISSYNGLSNPDRLLAGQVLYIPSESQAALATAQRSQLRLQWPVQGRLSSGYGPRMHPILRVWHFHGGIDIAAQDGTPVKAAAAGKVIKAGNLGNYGLGIVLQHAGAVTTWYGHNSKLFVRVGDTVKQGQTIAAVGRSGLSTGSHLDFRIKIGDQTVDPLEWLP